MCSWLCGSPAVLVHVAPGGPAVARSTFCCPDPQLISTRELAGDPADPGQVSLLRKLAGGVTCSTLLGVAPTEVPPSTPFNSGTASRGARWSEPCVALQSTRVPTEDSFATLTDLQDSICWQLHSDKNPPLPPSPLAGTALLLAACPTRSPACTGTGNASWVSKGWLMKRSQLT